MAEHERLAQRLALRVFFADPHSPWQRGTNENTNGLLRQYLPKGTDLSGYTQRELNAIAHRLNTRPRKYLDWATPLEVFTQLRHQSPVALGT
jgi:IS30 family transposase